MTTANTDAGDLIDVLLDDVLRAARRLRVDSDDGSSRRDAIRSVFAAIEGTQWELQRYLLDSAEHVFSEAERAFLRDVAFTISENGQVKEARAKLSLKQRTRFSARIVTRLHPSCSVDFESPQWSHLLSSLDVRDRLTHPKNRRDLDVSADELAAAIGGLTWYLGSVAGKIMDGVREYRETDEGRRGGLIRSLMRYTEGHSKRLSDVAPNRTDDASGDVRPAIQEG